MIGRQQIRPVVPDNGGSRADGVQGPLQAGPHGPLLGAAARTHRGAGAVGGVGQVEQVGTLSLVELERTSDRVENAGRNTAE
jgi:hypothetical protein